MNEHTPVAATRDDIDSDNVVPANNYSDTELESVIPSLQEQYQDHGDITVVPLRFRKIRSGEGIVTVRETINLLIPIPNINTVVDIINNDKPKEVELLLEAVASIVTQRARELVNDDPKLNARNFDTEKVLWNTIANLPKAVRGGGISKETWEAFYEHYIEIMPELTKRPLNGVTNAAKLLRNRCTAVKDNEKVLEALAGYLEVFTKNTPRLNEFKPIIDSLAERIAALLETKKESLEDIF